LAGVTVAILRHLSIRRDEVRAVIYSDYSLTGEWSGKPFKQSGKAMEVFVFHEGHRTNAGWQLG